MTVLTGIIDILQRTALGFVVLVAVFFGTVWTLVNFYNYYPLFQRQIDRLIRGVIHRVYSRPHRSSVVDASATDFVYPYDRTASEFVFPFAPAPESNHRPSIAILVPAYEEAEVIDNAICSIYNAEYPAKLLRVIPLVEPDDTATQAALDALGQEFPIDTLVIPSDYPGDPNKPRALNYGFEHTEAEIIGIVDAEVLLGETLLHEAATALTDGDGADFALSHLDMINEDDGWLNLLFRAEYGYWYKLVIPAFAHVGYPIPLGGTSCFFRRDVLAAISDARRAEYTSPWSPADLNWFASHDCTGAIPWDPENVTEDFELGLYLWTKGYEFRYLNGVTREESPLSLDGWMSQRTRWKKGKLYTFRHYVETPPETLRQRFHLYWQSLLPHLGPVNIGGLIFVFWLANMTGAIPSPIVQGILTLGLTFMIMVGVLYAYGYYQVSDKPFLTRLRRTLVVGLSLFLYWILQWIADIRALLQTYRGQFHWEKTEHLGRNLLTIPSATDQQTDAGDTSSPDFVTDGAATIFRSTGRLKGQRWTLSSIKRRGVLIGIISLAGILRIARLEYWSLWLDEIYTITFRAAIPIRDMLLIPYDPHPPLYFLLLHLWMDIGGHSRIVAGLFSVTFSVATVGMLYFFARYLYDDLTGLLAAGLLAISTAHIHFGRNIRMYPLLTFLALASWYAYLHLPQDRRRYDIGYIVLTVAMLYTHIYALFVLAAQQVYTILADTDGSFHRRWLVLQLIIGGSYSPWVAVLGQQVLDRVTGEGGTAINWIPAPSTALLRDTLLMYAGFPSLYPILNGSILSWSAAVVVLLIFNITILFSIITYRQSEDTALEYSLVDTKQAGLLWTFLFIPIGLPFIASYVFFPIYFPRYTLVASLPLFILVARGIVNLRSHQSWQRGVLIVIIAGAVVTGAGYYTGDSVEDWRGNINMIEDDVDGDDLLVIQPFWVESDVMYYYDGPTVEIMTLPSSSEVPQQALSDLRNQTGNHETVWLIRYQANGTDGVLTQLNATHRGTSVHHDGLISIYKYIK